MGAASSGGSSSGSSSKRSRDVVPSPPVHTGVLSKGAWAKLWKKEDSVVFLREPNGGWFNNLAMASSRNPGLKWAHQKDSFTREPYFRVWTY